MIRKVNKFGYIPILGLASLLSMLRSIIFAKVLNIQDFGLISSIFLVSSTVAIISSLGSNIYAQKILPVMYHNHNTEDAFIMNLDVSIITIITSCFLIFSYPLINIFTGISFYAYILSIVHSLSLQLFLIFQTSKRSKLQLINYSISLLGRSFCSMLFAWGVIKLGGGIYQAIVAEIICNTFFVLLVYLDEKVLVRQNIFDWSRVVQVLKKSTPLLFASLLMYITSNVDRWFGVSFLSKIGYGELSFLMIFITAALSVQALLNAGLFPQLSRLHSESSLEALKFTRKFSLALLAISLLLSFTIFVPIKYMVLKFFPHYGHLVHLIPVILIAACFKVSDFWGSLLLLKKSKLLLISQCVNLAIVFMCFTFGFVFIGKDVSTLIYLTSFISGVCYFLNMVFCTFKLN